MRKQKPFYWLLALGLLFYVSCRKSDFITTQPEKATSIERFFNLPETADPKLKAIAQSIRKQENEHPFLKDLLKEPDGLFGIKLKWWAQAQIQAMLIVVVHQERTALP